MLGADRVDRRLYSDHELWSADIKLQAIERVCLVTVSDSQFAGHAVTLRADFQDGFSVDTQLPRYYPRAVDRLWDLVAQYYTPVDVESRGDSRPLGLPAGAPPMEVVPGE